MRKSKDNPDGKENACQSCGKRAGLHFTSIDGGKVVEQHYCSQCIPVDMADQMPAGSIDLAIDEGNETMVPFALRNKLIVIDVEVNDEGPFSFIVDTGANKTLLMPWVAQKLRLETIKRGRRSVPEERKHEEIPLSVSQNVCKGGEVLAERARLASLRIGDIVFRKLEVVTAAVFSDSDMVIFSDKIAGIIGSDVLSRYVVTINYPKSWIKLKKPE